MLRPGIQTRSLVGIQIDVQWQPVGVTEQFLGQADVYHQRYTNSPHWTYLIQRGLDGLEIDRSGRFRVLDIGSGSGNTIFPLLRALPNAEIVASDISPQLLQILVEQASLQGDAHARLSAYCFDLHKDFFAEESFDLVVGGAVLHHMLDPIGALRNTAKWLKRGGWVFLVEPLEIGAHMFAAVYHLLLAELATDGPAELLDFFRAMIDDTQHRLGAPTIWPWTAQLDDKWFFSPTFIRRMADDLGFSKWRLRPASEGTDRMFTESVLGTLAVSGRWDKPVPQRMLELLNLLDSNATHLFKDRMQPNGLIYFQR